MAPRFSPKEALEDKVVAVFFAKSGKTLDEPLVILRIIAFKDVVGHVPSGLPATVVTAFPTPCAMTRLAFDVEAAVDTLRGRARANDVSISLAVS